VATHNANVYNIKSKLYGTFKKINQKQSCILASFTRYYHLFTVRYLISRDLKSSTGLRTVSSELLGFLLVFPYFWFCAWRYIRLAISSAFERT